MRAQEVELQFTQLKCLVVEFNYIYCAKYTKINQINMLTPQSCSWIHSAATAAAALAAALATGTAAALAAADLAAAV